jgi:hypothetical protein
MPGTTNVDSVVDAAGALRKSISTTEAALQANAAALMRSETELRMYTRGGAFFAAKRAQAEAAITKLRADRTQLISRLESERAKLGNLVVNVELSPPTLIGMLDASIPIAMLPVRLETRFFKNGTELRIRIFPDQVHLNTHEPELTADERRAGEDYWRARWLAKTDTEKQTAAWRDLAGRLGARRGRWVAKALTPVNLQALGAGEPQFPAAPDKPREWSRAAQVTALPERWVAVGYGAAQPQVVFVKWSNPVPDSLAASPAPVPTGSDPVPNASEMAIDEPMRWLVDYNKALAQGMAITVTAADLTGGATLAAGLSKLIVLGVDWTLKPEEASQRLSDLLSAHLYSDGLSFVPPGTPTNNTSETVAAPGQMPEAQLTALDPGGPPRAFSSNSASRLLSHALGFDAADLSLDGAPGSTLSDQATEQHLANALWRSTLGYYLDELFNPAGDVADTNPIISDAVLAKTRQHVVTHLHPGGPLPTLRIGKQPYGVLPVMAGAYKPSPGDTFTDDLFALLTRLRPFWARGLHKVPRMGDSSSRDELESTLLRILQTTPLSSTARFRRAFGSVTAANAKGLEKYQEVQTGIFNQIVGPHLGWPKPPRIASFVTDPRSHKLLVPWTQTGGVSETDPLGNNYIRGIAGILRGDRGIRDARAALTAQEDADTLLQSLLAHAAVEEIDQSANHLVHLHHRNVGKLPPAVPRAARVRINEVMRAEAAEPRPKVATAQTNKVYSRQELSQVILPTVTSKQTLAEYITAATRNPVLLRTPELTDLGGFLASLDVLATRPTAELDRAFRGILDAYSHRLDAWYTSLATKRLSELRAKNREGAYIGGYGWVFNLKPDLQPDSLGYVHAPSIPHATAAAILRSGHLSHQTGETAAGQTPFNIDMSSDRVRRALELLHAVAEGQPLAALLGYRLERQLKERNIALMRFVLPLRRLFPLRRNTQALPANQPVEAVAARDVVNGLSLLERWRTAPASILELPEIKAQNPTPDERNALNEEIARVADALDAASDVLTAESVYQTVLGNYERAGAAMAALDRQGRPPDPQVVRTPRSGKGYTQRVMVLLNESIAPGTWSTLTDARSDAEPRVNAWAGALLGDPARIVLAARVLRQQQEGAAPQEVDRLELPIAELRLSPLSLVFAAAPGGRQQPSQLEEHALRGFTAKVKNADESTIIELLEDEPASAPAGTIGLAALRAECDWIRRLVGDHRPASGRDLDIPEGMPGDGYEPEELDKRADALKQRVNDAAIALAAAISSAQLPALDSALLSAAVLGTPDSLPSAVLAGQEAEVLPLRLDQARAALASLQRVKDEVDKLEASIAGKTLTPSQAIEHHTACIRLVFGKNFPVLPRFRPSNVAELSSTQGEQPQLTAGDPLAPAGWLSKMALVRPATNLLASVLSGAELLRGSPTGTSVVAQLPHQPGQRWLALPFGNAAPADASLALFIHAHGNLDFKGPLSGFVCDEWHELIPAREETTAMSFHYDAPAARAPQAILLAVPADPTQSKWSVQTLLETIGETIALAQLRAVGPKEMEVLAGGLLPAVYLPSNLTKDVPSIDLFKLRARHASTIATAGVLGKELLK